MKILLTFLVYAITIIADPVGTHTRVNSSKLESKILSGRTAEKEEYKYVASLQLNGSHICSSARFQVGFLLTTGKCAWTIENGMIHEKKQGTAVIGDLNLEKGRRINVLKMAYHPRFEFGHKKSYGKHVNLGVVKIEDDDDEIQLLQTVHLHEKKIDSRAQKFDTELCGWDTRPVNNSTNNENINAEHSNNLHCTKIELYSRDTCLSFKLPGNYYRFMMCGHGKYLEEVITAGDIGIPLTKSFQMVDSDEIYVYIIGITVSSFQTEIGEILCFIRTDGDAYRHIQKMVKRLQPESANCNSSNQDEVINQSSKRHKVG